MFIFVIWVSFEKLEVRLEHYQAWIKDAMGFPLYVNEVKCHVPRSRGTWGQVRWNIQNWYKFFEKLKSNCNLTWYIDAICEPLAQWMGVAWSNLLFWVIFMPITMILKFPASYCHLTGWSPTFTCCIFKIHFQHRTALREYGASVAGRGLMHCNSTRHRHDATSAGKWRPLHKPQWFEVSRKVRIDDLYISHNAL